MAPENNDWPQLSLLERRVLGVLVEKQKTTDTYPLTLNSVLVGSNQKSNREPVLDLKDDAVEEALQSAQKKGLVVQLISGRVDKWKHRLYEAWNVSSVELAILAELLLRGPQTEGELRARAARMDEIRDVDHLREILKPLAVRKLIVYLTPEGRRGTILTHGFQEPQELEQSRANALRLAAAEPAVSSSLPKPSQNSADLTAFEMRLAANESEIGSLRDMVSQLQEEIARLARLLQETRKTDQ